MYFLNNQTAQIDDLLARAAEKLQLDKSRKERIESSYNAVQDFIKNDKTFFKDVDFEIYPQGSVRIATTVKPIENNEFDLDIVLHILGKNYMENNPMTVYNELKRRLRESEKYDPMIELKTRCVRLNYSGDFHMDILPGCQQNLSDSNIIMIPDRELKEWLTSNPRGYGDWFLRKAESVKQTLLEKAYAAEKIPIDEFASKKPLQRAVQIIKRYRDLHFEKSKDYITPSIVLTTIAGEYYNGEDSIFNTIDSIVSQIYQKINLNPKQRLKVTNPVNREEDFTDKWDNEPEYFLAFTRFIDSLYSNWQNLKKDHGILEESNILKGILGDTLFSDSIKDQTLLVEQSRQKGTLFATTSTGMLSSAKETGKPLQKNTFFGE
jgi:hypothetical protein